MAASDLIKPYAVASTTFPKAPAPKVFPEERNEKQNRKEINDILKMSLVGASSQCNKPDSRIGSLLGSFLQPSQYIFPYTSDLESGL